LSSPNSTPLAHFSSGIFDLGLSGFGSRHGSMFVAWKGEELVSGLLCDKGSGLKVGGGGDGDMGGGGSGGWWR
jgi:hypothetical protein